jgi:hypothetical protein
MSVEELRYLFDSGLLTEGDFCARCIDLLPTLSATDIQLATITSHAFRGWLSAAEDSAFFIVGGERHNEVPPKDSSND